MQPSATATAGLAFATQPVVAEDGSINLALTRGYESILDVLTGALGDGRVRSLTWHYRSHDERLIASRLLETRVDRAPIRGEVGIAGMIGLRRPTNVHCLTAGINCSSSLVLTPFVGAAQSQPADLSKMPITDGVCCAIACNAIPR